MNGGVTRSEKLRRTPKCVPRRLLAVSLSLAIHAAIIAGILTWPASHSASSAADMPFIMVTLMPDPDKEPELRPVSLPPLRKKAAEQELLTIPPEKKKPPEYPSPVLASEAAIAEISATAPESSAPADVSPAMPALTASEAHAAALAAARNEYAKKLWTHLAHYKPRRIRGKGTVVVAFILSPEGDLLSVELQSDNGNDALRRMAIAAIRKARPYPKVPPVLGDGPFRFEIAFDAQ